MKFIVLPLIDAQFIFTEEELAHMRKSTDGTEVIVHEDILVHKRAEMGFQFLPESDTNIESTYPVYEYGSDSLNSLLSSGKWSEESI
ncbi:hypothetical protein QUW56_02820 [Phocaeicola barnesiae]|uniref:hypothetical protein n=1 Tax=Phocaeicola barnesiae TaxID=376804 RepID=UPI0025A49924|nr:hypothetical protein [Phocaeicola barnesiae]MDM8232332.1 hypothetical protein [Phocaeicola barnesiae]